MLGVIGNKFSIGKETYHPFSVEMHYFRIDKRYWSICFERIKRAGFSLIATAVPWNIHQDENKHYDFSGTTDPSKDLIVFLELAREFGFKVILRPGPIVKGQLENGGLPKFVFSDLNVFARDAAGQECELPDDYGVKGGYLPSYLHKTYQFHIKNYFKSFIEITKNYVHPRGPIFMVELDYETSFGGLLEPDSADYNPQVLAEYYPSFLEELYGDIKKLNAAYKEKNASFEKVEPPRKFTDLDPRLFVKAMDWMRFRQYILMTYLENLEEVFTAYTVEPLIFRSLYFKPGSLLPAFDLVPEDRSPFLGTNVFPGGTYFDLAVKARFLKSEYGFAFATSFVSGGAAEDPNREESVAPIPPKQRRFYMAASLASGFNGLNHYMFVDRDHWHGAPLHKDGTISDGYPVVREFNTAITEVGLEEMEAKAQVVVVGNRLYEWMKSITFKKMFPYVGKLLDESATGFCRDLMRLKINFGVRENRDWESLKEYKLVFIPSTEVMSSSDQEAIVELLKAGVDVIMCGLMPRYDETMRDCQILANHLRIKTSVDYGIGTADYKNGSFPTYTYGSIRSTDDSKVRKLVKNGAKLIGVSSSRFKGSFHLFSFDIASGGQHNKLSFIESIVVGKKIAPFAYCSDPSVDIAFHLGEKKGLLFIVAPPAGELSDGIERGSKEVIIKVDLKAAGYNSPRLKLTNLFNREESKPLRISTKELKDGIQLPVNFPDGYIFLIERR